MVNTLKKYFLLALLSACLCGNGSMASDPMDLENNSNSNVGQTQTRTQVNNDGPVVSENKLIHREKIDNTTIVTINPYSKGWEELLQLKKEFGFGWVSIRRSFSPLLWLDNITGDCILDLSLMAPCHLHELGVLPRQLAKHPTQWTEDCEYDPLIQQHLSFKNLNTDPNEKGKANSTFLNSLTMLSKKKANLTAIILRAELEPISNNRTIKIEKFYGLAAALPNYAPPYFIEAANNIGINVKLIASDSTGRIDNLISHMREQDHSEWFTAEKAMAIMAMNFGVSKSYAETIFSLVAQGRQLHSDSEDNEKKRRVNFGIKHTAYSDYLFQDNFGNTYTTTFTRADIDKESNTPGMACIIPIRLRKTGFGSYKFDSKYSVIHNQENLKRAIDAYISIVFQSNLFQEYFLGDDCIKTLLLYFSDNEKVLSFLTKCAECNLSFLSGKIENIGEIRDYLQSYNPDIFSVNQISRLASFLNPGKESTNEDTSVHRSGWVYILALLKALDRVDSKLRARTLDGFLNSEISLMQTLESYKESKTISDDFSILVNIISMKIAPLLFEISNSNSEPDSKRQRIRE
ncbi:MAG: hypothetical protein ACPGXY_04240 [Alphaproteobacteria bacterium]